MPLYEYRCSSCGHQQEFLQKWSDAPLATCNACGKDTFQKLLTAAGFKLKGSGWYATDFKNSGAKAPAANGAKADAKEASKSEGKSDGKSESKSESKSEGGKGTPSASSGAGGCASCS